MFLPYTRAASVGSFKIPVAAAASDVTPNAVNWTDTYSGCISVVGISQTISGINTTINLVVTWTHSGSSPALASAYSKNGGAYITFNSGDTISVANNDTLRFRMTKPTATFYTLESRTFTVKNSSDGNVTLDTFTLSTDCEP